MSKKYLYITIPIILALAILLLELSGTINLYEKPVAKIENIDGINYSPPTEEEQKAGDAQKDKIIDNQNGSSSDSVPVVIVDASQYGDEIEVRAFASKVVPDGICIFSFEKDGQKISRETLARADASTTPCISLTVPRSDFPVAGEWKLTVSYQSSEISGSQSTSIIIE